jgi:hypothetical protein
MHRWEDNIRMDFKEIGFDTRNWVDSAQDRDYWRDLVNAALNFQVPQAKELVSYNTIYQRSAQISVYADNSDIMGRIENNVKNAFKTFKPTY